MSQRDISWVHSRLQHIVDGIGPRPSGSPAARQLEAYIINELNALGYHTRQQPFVCQHWQPGSFQLTVNDSPLSCRLNNHTPSCSVNASLVAAGTLQELEALPAENRVLLLHGDLTAEPWFPKNFAYLDLPEQKALISLVEKKAPAALITAAAPAVPHFPIIHDGDFDIPSVTVSAELADWLLKQPQAAVSLNIDARRSEGAGGNVLASLSQGCSKTVVVSAHMDTAPFTPGAVDNAGGVVTLLLLARLLKEADLGFNVDWVFFNGEDHCQNPGEAAYWSELGAETQHLALNINVDGVGFAESPNTVAHFSCPEAWVMLMDQRVQSQPNLAWTDPWPQSDHAVFWQRGIPAFALGSGVTSELSPWLHTPDDNMTLVQADKLVAAAGDIAWYLQNVTL